LVIDEQLPSILYLEQTVLEPGQTIDISGYNLSGAEAIRFAGRTSTITSHNSVLVSALVPTTTVSGYIEIDVNVPGRGVLTAVSPDPFYLFSAIPMQGVSSRSQFDGIGLNADGSELLVIDRHRVNGDKVVRYDAETLVKLQETNLLNLQTTAIISFDVSPSGDIGIITQSSFHPGGTEEWIYVFRISNPQEYSTCSGIRFRGQRAVSRAFVFDGRSDFAYAKWPLDQPSGQEGIFRIDLRNPSAISCSAIGILPGSSGAGGFQATLVTDLNDGLVVMDRALGLAVLDIVETSTTFGQYSSWQGPGEYYSHLFWDTDPQYVWMSGGVAAANTKRRNLYRNEAATVIHDSYTASGSSAAQSADRRWLFANPGGFNQTIVIDLLSQRVAARRAMPGVRSQTVIVAHPTQTRFYVDLLYQELFRIDLIEP
jgi:hypothetical protein